MPSDTDSSPVELFTSLRYDIKCAKVEPEYGPLYMLNYHRDRLVEAARFFNYQAVLEDCEGENGLDWLKAKLENAVEDWTERNQGRQGELCLKIRAIFASTGDMRTEIGRVPPASSEGLYPSSLPPPPTSNDSQLTKPFKPSPLTGGALHSSESTQKPTRYLTLDTQPTQSSPVTVFKTMSRSSYDDARERILPQSRRDHQEYAEANHDVLMYDEEGFVSETSVCTPYFWRNGGWVTPSVSDADSIAAELRGGQRGSTRRWALQRGLCTEAKISKDELVAGEICWISNGVRGFNMALLGEDGGLKGRAS